MIISAITCCIGFIALGFIPVKGADLDWALALHSNGIDMGNQKGSKPSDRSTISISRRTLPGDQPAEAPEHQQP